MNARYRRNTVIKLLNLTNSVNNFSSNSRRTENSGIKNSTLAREQVSEQSTLAHEHLSTQGTLAREPVSTFLARGTRNLADSISWNKKISKKTKELTHVESFVVRLLKK